MKISSILAVILTLRNHRISVAFASSVHIFSAENESVLRKDSLGAPQLSVFCWRNKIPTLSTFWSVVLLNINISKSAEFKTHFGETSEEVEFLADTDAVFWFFSEPERPSQTMILNPFLSSCLGITSDAPFILDCSLVHIDIPSLLITLLGTFVFSHCKFLSKFNIVASSSKHIIIGFCPWVLLAGKISRKYRFSALASGGLKSFTVYLSVFAWHEIYNLERIGKLKDSFVAIFMTSNLRLVNGHRFIIVFSILQPPVSE